MLIRGTFIWVEFQNCWLFHEYLPILVGTSTV